ncbi:MAG: hypothetical protein ACKV2T_37400 [Kofleriaceae bacterium]
MSVGQLPPSVRSMLRVPRSRGRWSNAQWAAALVLTGGVGVVARYLGRLWTWTLVITILGLGIGRVPLFGVLGYELAFAMTIPAAILGLDVGSAIAREYQRVPAEGLAGARYAGRTLAFGALVGAAMSVAIMLIPAVISAVRGLWIPTCDWWFGVKAYALMPLTTAALAGAAGHAIGVVFPRADRRRAAAKRGLVARAVFAFMPFSPAIVVAVFALWRFYGAPPVFTYNAILGYFPGNLYDENIQVGMTLVWSRLEQVAWLVAGISVIAYSFDVPTYRAAMEPRPAGRPRLAIVLAVLAIAGGLRLRTWSGDLGYAPDPEDIQEALGGRIETEHFVIYYAKVPPVESIIGLVAEDHEFRYAQVVAQLGVPASRKLHSYYFADREQKARWMGARDVEMAKPWRHEIYLEHRSWPHGSLRHEIAHAVASEFGDPMFGVAARRIGGIPVMFQPGLIEGLAVAVDWPGGSYERMTPHELVRVLQELGKQPSIGALLSLQFFNFSSQTSYTTAGSFLKHLLDGYGAQPLRALYQSGGDFEAAYGKPLATLEAEWRAMIGTINLPAGAVEASRERFRMPSVFSRPCPHAIAARRQAAQQAIGEGNRTRALALMGEVCADAPDEPRYRLELADLLGAGDAGERMRGTTMITHLALDHVRVTSSLRAEAYERLAVRAAVAANFAELRRLLVEGTKLQLSDTERRQLDAMLFALDHTGPAGPALRGYFFAASAGLPDDITWAKLAQVAEPTLGFTHYLVGLQHYNKGELADAARNLAKGLLLGLPGSPFMKNGARRLALAAYRANDPTLVRIAISMLGGEGMTTGDKLLAEDWAQRLDFDARATSRR